ncbi:MAG: Uma2 family endonuclease [Lachnospiraceae bacterium]|nr:Uma2 family endonuclease [Lachnospiraceae bacterium]
MEPALAYRYDQGDKTLKDYLSLPEGTRAELIDGVFYDMAAPTGLHQRLIIKIAGCLEAFIEKNGGPCVTLIAPFDVQLFNDVRTCVQPDILVLCNRDRLRLEPEEYTFADKVPVGIWSEACEMDFAQIYESVQFLYLL